MMTQEEYVDVLEMRAKGLTFEEIGAELGMHPATISKWCRQGGPPPARTTAAEDRAVTPVWADRLTALRGGHPKQVAHSLFDVRARGGLGGRCCRTQGGGRWRRARYGVPGWVR